MSTEKTQNAQQRAVSKYHEANFTWVSLGLHKTTDADIIEGLKNMKNRSAFIKDAIRKALGGI